MNWKQIAEIATSVGSLTAVLTVIGVGIGGIFALSRHRRDVRIHAAELLLKVEEEFRVVMRTCVDLEYLDRYETLLAPVLRVLNAGTAHAPDDIETAIRLDRCLRFFFLCTVLNSDLKVEENAIARAYYYYVCVMAEPGKRMELQEYIEKSYPRLNHWMKCHRRCMDHYRATGHWEWTLVTGKRRWSLVGSVP